MHVRAFSGSFSFIINVTRVTGCKHVRTKNDAPRCGTRTLRHCHIVKHLGYDPSSGRAGRVNLQAKPDTVHARLLRCGNLVPGGDVEFLRRQLGVCWATVRHAYFEVTVRTWLLFVRRVHPYSSAMYVGRRGYMDLLTVPSPQTLKQFLEKTTNSRREVQWVCWCIVWWTCLRIFLVLLCRRL